MVIPQRSDASVWKWISGILITIILTVVGTYWSTGAQTETNVTNLQSDVRQMQAVQATSVTTLARVVDILNAQQTINAVNEMRLKTLEHQAELDHAGLKR